MGRLYICLHENHKHQPNVGIYSIHGSYGIGQPPTPFAGWVDESLWFLVYASAPKSRRGATSALDSEPSEFPFLAGETGRRWGIWSGAAEGDFQKNLSRSTMSWVVYIFAGFRQWKPSKFAAGYKCVEKRVELSRRVAGAGLRCLEIMENAGFCV